MKKLKPEMSHIETIKALWHTTFGDENPFLDFYFERIYTEQRNVEIVQNSHIISTLQAIPFPMKIADRIVPTAYLSGILTNKEFQKCGFMRQLLHKTHRQLYYNGVWATTLIPSEKYLFQIYEKFGYESIFKVDVEKHIISNNSKKPPKKATQRDLLLNARNDKRIVELQKNERKIAYEYFNKKSLERGFSLLTTYDYFENICDLAELESRKIFVAKLNENIAGIALVSEKGEVLEIFFENENIKKNILDKIMQEFDLQEMNLQTYGNNRNFGMLRILNVEKFLNWFAQNNPDKEFSFNISDPEIAENNGFFILNNGFCIRQCYNNHLVTTINELAKIIFSDTTPAMTYMMNV